MSFEFTLPNLGENIDSADVSTILVAVGDEVDADQDLLEVETGKSAMPVPCPVKGRVAEIKIGPGDSVGIGDVLMIIDASGSGDGSVMAETMAEAAEEEPAPEPAPTPVPKAEPAPAPSAPPSTPQPTAPAIHAEKHEDVRAIPASPSVRRFAREIGVSVADVTGTGNNGRITIDDVKAYSKALNQGRTGSVAPVAAAGAPAVRPLPDFPGPTHSESMSTVRKVTADHMSFCWQTVPHVTQFDKADIEEIETQRKLLQKRVEAQGGGKLTVTAILVKIVASALRKFPVFGASVDMVDRNIVYKDYVNIGIAVDTPRGLVVPVIKDADSKNIIELTADLAELSVKARDGKLTPADMQGGCFTISNLGGIGGHAFTPIVNWPEVAILGVARGEREPVWNGDAFEPRLRLPLSLSYDHRIIDGADAARFLRWICEALANPLLISLEG